VGGESRELGREMGAAAEVLDAARFPLHHRVPVLSPTGY